MKRESDVNPHFCCNRTWPWTCTLATRGQHTTQHKPTFETSPWNIWKRQQSQKSKISHTENWTFGDELKILQHHKQQLWLCIVRVHLQEASSTVNSLLFCTKIFMLLSAPYRASVILLIVTQALLLIWSYNSILFLPDCSQNKPTVNSVHKD